MQSDGGLVSVNKFSGFKAILLGPAAGLLGFALIHIMKKKIF